MLPDTITLTDEQFKIFLEKTLLTDFTRRALDTIAAHIDTTPAAKPEETAQGERA